MLFDEPLRQWRVCASAAHVSQVSSQQDPVILKPQGNQDWGFSVRPRRAGLGWRRLQETQCQATGDPGGPREISGLSTGGWGPGQAC